jgi:hypothetical protein
MKPIRMAEKVLPYVAGVLFVSMWAAAVDVSSHLSAMDSQLGTYHDLVAVKVLWFESKACLVLPPDGYVSNCNYVGGIRAITLLSALLAVVLIAYMILRRKNAEKPQQKQPRITPS